VVSRFSSTSPGSDFRAAPAQCGADAPAYNATGVQRVIAGDPGPLEMGASWDRTRVDSLQGAITWADKGSTPTT
jgi:hypothetical protein